MKIQTDMDNSWVETLLFQMGKVASTAIADAIRRAGGDVLQAHIGCPERLRQTFDIMVSDTIDEAVANRMYQDYQQELRATFLLARRRAAANPAKEPLKVISLTRDPLEWYWSNFAQNYDHNRSLLERYYVQNAHAANSATDFSPDRVLWELMSVGFEVLNNTQCAIDAAEALPQLMQEADARDPSNVVFSQLNRFLVPLRWFDEDFLPATGVNVYDHTFDDVLGYGRIELPGLSMLLLRYEDLANHAEKIADFTGLAGLELRAANATEDKDVPVDIASLRARALSDMPAPLVERIYATRYAKTFGYSACSNITV